MKHLLFLATLLSLALISVSGNLSACTPGDDDSADATKFRKQSAANLRQLVIAMHNYHNDYNCMPPHAIYDKAGKAPLLSWRVAILPYLEPHRDMDNLYKRFKMDEPWDSDNNKALVKEMPKIFAMPGVKSQPGMTHYQVFTMPLNLPAGKKGMYMPMFSLSKSKLTLGQLTVQDGTSNTICITEATTPVEWTKPSDMNWEHDDAPLPKLGIRPGTDEFLASFGDASVREIRKKIDDMDKHTRLIKQLIGRRDGMNEDVSPIVK